MDKENAVYTHTHTHTHTHTFIRTYMCIYTQWNITHPLKRTKIARLSEVSETKIPTI